MTLSPFSSSTPDAATREAAATREIVTRDPRTGAPLLRFVPAGPAEVAAACERARSAQSRWGAIEVARRATVLRRARAILLERAEDLIDTLVAEGGKVRFEAISLEIAPAVLNLSFVAARAPRVLADEAVRRFLPPLRTATRRFAPRGVLGLVTPWNYPLAIPMATLAAGLAAGNAIVWKPAEQGTLVARKLVDVLEDAGVPEGTVVLVEGDAATGAALVDGALDHLTFVGSTEAGRRVAARCGERLLPSILELGGNASAIVLDGGRRGADLERASRAIVYGGLANRGHSCVGIERVYAVRSMHAELFAAVASLVDGLRPGRDLGVTPVEAQERRVRELIDDARAAGCTVLGGDAGRPFLVDTHGARPRLLEAEAFGPVVTFHPVRDVDEAVREANAHAQQLTAYVFAADRRSGRDVARRLKAPHVVLDDAMVSYAMMEVPFGGAGASGWGRVHGDDGLRALCAEQFVVEDPLRLPREAWWPPYSDDRGGMALALLRGGQKVADACGLLRRR
jgi:succinate-semialdehyde dehydrogenase/glutarate-semialdehyde dehydrogenase